MPFIGLMSILLLQIFKDNGWEVVTCVEPEDHYSLDPNYGGKSGKWIAMKVLSWEEKPIFVMEHDIPMIDQLEGLGFKVITVPFKNVVEFGGGLHCATQDIRREGDRECYFPNLAEKSTQTDQLFHFNLDLHTTEKKNTSENQ